VTSMRMSAFGKFPRRRSAGASSAASLPPMRTRNHASHSEGIPKRNCKVPMPKTPKPRKSKNNPQAKSRFPIRRLNLLHRRLRARWIGFSEVKPWKNLFDLNLSCEYLDIAKVSWEFCDGRSTGRSTREHLEADTQDC
jgi:hypothetical protein